MKKNNNIVIFTIVTVIIAVVSFFGGMKFSQSKGPRGMLGGMDNPPTGNGQRGLEMDRGQGNQAAGGFVSGEITKKESDSITVKLPNGGSKIVLYSKTTEIEKSTKASLDDLKVGQSISTNGETNEDGSITAKSIQLR